MKTMKRIYQIVSLLIICLISIGLNACGGDDEPKAPEDSYYVKYELQTSSRYVFNTVQVEVTTEKGIEVLEVNRNWDGTFGPFEYGTTLSFKVTMFSGNYNTTSFRGKISVSKNNAPFVFKAEENVNNIPLSMSYTIDF